MQEEKYSRDVDYSEYSQLKRENKHLKDVNELLKHQFELTNGREVSTNALLAAGRNILKLTPGNAWLFEKNKDYQNGSPLVHLTGIEPAHLSILDPKSSASASSATGAYLRLWYTTIINS